MMSTDIVQLVFTVTNAIVMLIVAFLHKKIQAFDGPLVLDKLSEVTSSIQTMSGSSPQPIDFTDLLREISEVKEMLEEVKPLAVARRVT